MNPNISIHNQNHSNNKRYEFQDFIRKHRLLALVVIIGSVLLFATIVVLGISSFLNKDSQPANGQLEPENAPYITFEHEYLIEFQVPETLAEEINFQLRLVLLSADELNTATINSDNQEIIASIDEDSWSINDSSDTTNVTSMDIDLTDGRTYNLTLLFDDTYQDEYAIVVLKPLSSSDTHDYVITFTSNTTEYYEKVIENAISNNDDTPEYSESSLKDHLTGNPVEPIPESATQWLNSLKLHDPEFIYSTLPPMY